MKISRLEDCQGGGHFSLNSSKSRMFAHSASEYWDTYTEISEKGNSFNLWKFMFVGLPAAHMALELIVKAFVTFYNSTYDPRKDRHNVSKIITSNATAIAIFQPIAANSEKMDLIGTLEKGWEGLRYAECSLESEGKDRQILQEIMTHLMDEYKKISGLKI